MGQYGFLARINLENLHLFQVEGDCGQQRPKQEWQVRIDGIEGCAVYLTPVHDYCYNHIIIGDALKILPTLPTHNYELILAIDIIEHLTPADGLIFLSQMKRITRKAVLVSTPKEFIPQEVAANPYENHRSLWSMDDLLTQGFTTILPNEMSWIAVYQIL
ncbi:MAG: hypothetical protein BWK79_05945 [Beggiatoa sp. IS2]|nr:MAG: hypothetical protein BWK79_05945 [Beggiatoa sp. IS2]